MCVNFVLCVCVCVCVNLTPFLFQLRNLCYMVTKREKMRRELYRAREEVFWQEHAVLTDDSSDLDDNAVQRVLTMCKDNFSGDGSLPAAVEGDCPAESALSFRVSSTADSSSTTSSSGDCSSTEHRSVNGGDSGGEAADEEETEESETEEDLFSSPARRTRSNSLLVNPSCLSIDSAAGSSKEPESIASGVIETPTRKRTREKTQTSPEASASTPKRVLRNTVRESEEPAVERDSVESETPRRRKIRHLSFPNDVTDNIEASNKETIESTEEDGAVSRNSRARFTRTGNISGKTKTAEIRSEGEMSEKSEVDEESRKENDPLRQENMVEFDRPVRTVREAKRKRSKSTTAIDDDRRGKQARMMDFMGRKSPNRKDLSAPKSPRTRANRRKSDSEESDRVATDSDADNSKRAPSSRSFTNGRKTSSANSSCPHCKLQHDKLTKCSWRYKEGSHTAECEDNWNRRELRLRSFQSPKSRARCSSVVSPKPHCCGSLMSKFCHATVT